MTNIQDTITQAEYELARAKARAYTQYADTLGSTFESVAPEVPVRVRGERQAEILAIPELFSTRGMSVGEMSRKIDYDEPNCHTAVKALEKQGLLEVAFDGTPRRYRLAIELRRNKILRAASVIPGGRWSAYGEVGVAATGNKMGARAVASSAAHNAAFPTPWRVINADGTIPSGWKGLGGGAERCLAQLEDEGVSFSDGHADPSKKMGWEEIDLLVQALAEDDADVAS